jgi:hypothetical protein
MNSRFIHDERAHARRIDFDRKEMVQRGAGVIQQSCSDRFRVADYDDRSIRLNTSEILQMTDDAMLKRPHAFSAWWATCAAPRIPFTPSGIAFEVCKRPGCPRSIVDLVNVRRDFHRKTEVPGKNRGGLLSSPLRARLYGCWFPRYYRSATRHLSAAEIIELHARHSAAEPLAQHGMMAMTDEMYGLYHGDLMRRP